MTMLYILLADGFEEIEALTPLDMLRRAGCTVKTVSITAHREVLGAHGIPVLADLTAKDALEEIDLLVLPGGMPGSKNLDESPFVSALIERTLERGGRLAAICAAPMVLGHRGLLEGKTAVCYPGFETELEGAIVSGAPVVTDGNITTAAGMGVALLFAAELVRLTVSEKAARDLLFGCSGMQARVPTFVEGEFLGSEMARVAEFLRSHFDSDSEVLDAAESEEALFDRAVAIALERGKVSASLLQRRLPVGYGKAARLIDRMYEMGIVGAPNGQGPREVLICAEDYEKMRSNKSE